MAKITNGICGNARGGLAGIQFQTLRGVTIARAKQPRLGPGTPTQTEYRRRFAQVNAWDARPEWETGGAGFTPSEMTEEQKLILLKFNVQAALRPYIGRVQAFNDNYYQKYMTPLSLVESGVFVYFNMNVHDSESGQTYMRWAARMVYSDGSVGSKNSGVTYYNDQNYGFGIGNSSAYSQWVGIVFQVSTHGDWGGLYRYPSQFLLLRNQPTKWFDPFV